MSITVDTRGASTTLGYSLTLGITTLLITGLLFAGGSFVEDERERAIRGELSVIGQQVAADIQAADRLVRAGGDPVAISRDLPDTVAGSQYTIEVVVDDNGESSPEDTYLRLTSTRLDVVVEIDFVVQSDIRRTSFGGGESLVRYESGNDGSDGDTTDELVVSDE